MAQLNLTIVTPEQEIYRDQVDAINVPTQQGELGLLPNHANLVAQLAPGELRVKKGNQTLHLATGGGILQISKNSVSVITDSALKAEDIDEKEAEDARRRAQEALSQTLSDEEYAITLTMLEKSVAQLKVKRRHRAKTI